MTFRVAIVGTNPNRVAKALSVVVALHEDDVEQDISFLPLVATFGSYEDEDGAEVKYLANVTYHGDDGRQKGSSLAPFYDEVVGKGEDQGKLAPIEVFAFGCGIEDEKEIQQIRTFLTTLGGEDGFKHVVMECIKPISEYATMREETDAFRQLDPEAKQEATEQQTLGPGKMAKFVLGLMKKGMEKKLSGGKDVVEEKEAKTEDLVEETEEESAQEVDPTKNRYACRMCRRVLFGDDDLQDPPHAPLKHAFNRRKDFGIMPGSNCQSLFLGFGLAWMGDTSPGEGKFGCPHCNAKLGNWKWAGAQCSCGTWVTPAIQVPRSKVDVISSRPPSLTN
jgi:dual specificity phosphatase 12